MPFDATAKEKMLDTITPDIDAVGVHTADPGTADDNEVSGNGYARLDPTFAAADGDEVALSANLEFDGPADTDVWGVTWWAGANRYGKAEVVSGTPNFDSQGKWVLTTATRLRITDPA